MVVSSDALIHCFPHFCIFSYSLPCVLVSLLGDSKQVILGNDQIDQILTEGNYTIYSVINKETELYYSL